MKKKLVATVLAGVMALSVAMTGCGSSSDTADGTFTPTKSIQWMCTSSAGGGSDIFTRMIGDIMTTNGMVNDQTIVVTNKTDGAGEVGRNEVAMMKKNPDYQLLTFNSGDLMPMVENTKNRSSNFRILAIMAVDKQLLFKGAGAKYDTFADVINAVENGEKVVIGGSKGDDIATYQALIAELGVSEDNLTYITYDSTGDAITAALGGHVEYVISKPAAASEYVTAGSLVPILAFAGGVFVADCIQGKYKYASRIHWRQGILLLEILILLLVGFLPKDQNMLATVLVSFSCAMQVQTFRKVGGYSYASTMCIGNLRSGTAAFSAYLREKRPEQMRQALY